jgi:hypothetical protein
VCVAPRAQICHKGRKLQLGLIEGSLAKRVGLEQRGGGGGRGGKMTGGMGGGCTVKKSTGLEMSYAVQRYE